MSDRLYTHTDALNMADHPQLQAYTVYFIHPVTKEIIGVSTQAAF
ncbi:hypothetical protein GPLA_0881 [Paraglaciecola polaris LMG 21857]|uniref:Uncharacterized protein n=1 Tax=Paraglaciecola polaris LMG 21857 TaxID=1129793 RepID=K6ZNE2_9ALTE|nr:hypothetical protein GPLA_0881 [Paraglaciecola polaris LMG 21857]